MTKPDTLTLMLQADLTSARKTIADLASALAKHPGRALDESMKGFEAAAKIEAIEFVLDMIVRCIPVENIAADLRLLVMSAARNPSFSTSATSNLMAALRAAAMAQMIERLERF